MSNIIYPKSKIYTDGNVTGSGTITNPVDLKDDISLSSITASNIVITETASINILNTVEANSLKIGDKYITIMSGANTQAELDGAGILFGSGSADMPTGSEGSVAHIIYNDVDDKIEIFPGLKVSGSAQILGDITASNVSGSLIGTSSYSLNSDMIDGRHANEFALTGSSNSFNGNQTVTGSITITGNLTASNISGTLIGPANGILSGSYPSPSGLKGPIIPISGTTTLSTIAQGNNLTIDPSGSLSLKSHAYVGGAGGGINLYAEGATPSSVYSHVSINSRDGSVTLAAGKARSGTGAGYVNIETGKPDSWGIFPANFRINIGDISEYLGQINIGTTTSTSSVAIINIGQQKTPIVLNGPEVRVPTILTPLSNSSIQVKSPTIHLTPTSSITMSAKPTVEYSNFNGNAYIPNRNYPNGVRVSLINTTDYSICFLNDTSTVPIAEGGVFSSSSLKLGASQRTLNKWGILELQYQASGSSNAGYWVETNFSNYLTGCVDTSNFALLSGSNVFTGNETVTGSVYVQNSISASNLTSSGIYANYIDFNTSTYTNPPPPPVQLGRIFYNGATGDLTTYIDTNGLYLNNGQQLIQKVKNIHGSTITRGQVIHITGAVNSSSIPRVKLADWTNDGLSANTLGLVMDSTIADQGEGHIVVAGILQDVDTSAYNSGDVLYLSSSGNLTNVKPLAPKHNVSIGQVVRSNGPNGSIYVKIQNGYELDELHDVSASVGKLDGDLLSWDNTNSVWKNTKSLTGSYHITGNLSFSSNYGINFGASSGSNSTSTTITDYEEGTWTPSANFQISGASGYYTKIGNRVFISAELTVGTGSDGTTSYVYNIPYTSDITVPVPFSNVSVNVISIDNGHLSKAQDYIYTPSITSGTIVTFGANYIAG